MEESAPKLHYELSRADVRRLLLYGYYHRPGWRWVRMLAGPVMLVMGLLILGYPGRFNAVFGGVVIGYAVYYSIRPLLVMLAQTRKMGETRSTTLRIVPGEALELEDGETTSRLEIDRIKDVGLSGGYLTVAMQLKKRVFFHVPLHAVKEGDPEVFAERLAEEAGVSRD